MIKSKFTKEEMKRIEEIQEDFILLTEEENRLTNELSINRKTWSELFKEYWDLTHES